jgi:peptidoglycan/LPS O-acetylase OafA/YrhL
MKYRREIDGLRALAIIPVVCFHAGFRAFSGGFVGVDVFFVISGYLITALILAEKRQGTFTLANFYQRRARRILPALFVMMTFCLPFAWIWMMPDDLRDFSQTLVAVSTFSSNILFWIKSGYFDSANELKPLLHTWTLAVEEQYYLLFPCLLLLAWGLGKRRILCILAALALCSLALAQWGCIHQPRAAFYLLPTRAWELLAGVLAAFYLSDDARPAEHESDWISEACGIAGLSLIALAVFYFDRNTPFPGLYALVPTLGAVLIVLFVHGGTHVAKLLGSRPLVGIGLISYSTYLWHQPLFAFARLRNGAELSTTLRVVLSIGAVLLAYATWRFVETPFRKKGVVSTRTMVACGVAASVSFMALGAYGNHRNGFFDRLTAEQQEIYSYTQFDFSKLWRDGKCFLDPEQTYSDFAEECQQTDSNAGITLIWGDSHAAALTPGMRKLLPNVVQYTASACPPVIDIEFNSRPHCKEINRFVLREVGRLRPSRIFLHADWLAYKEEAPAASIEKTIGAILGADPQATVTLVGVVPQWWPSLPVVILRKHIPLNSDRSIPNPMFDELAASDRELRSAAVASGALFASPLEDLCDKEDCKVITAADGRFQLMAWDRVHLTEAGSALLAKMLLDNRR